MFYLINVLFVVIFFFGKYFLESGAGPLNGFALLIAISAVIFLSRVYDCLAILGSQLWLVVFCLAGFGSIALSYLGVYHFIFGIPTVSAYVIRQGYFFPMFLLFVPVFTLAWREGLMKYLNEREFQIHPLITGAVVIALLLIGYYNLSGNILLLIPILFISKRNKLLSLLFLFVWYFFSYTGIVNTIMLAISVMYILTNFLLTRKTFLAFAAVAVILMMSLGTANILRLSQIDSNSAWRFYVWTKNIQYSLVNTYGAGVGYGTPYFLGTKYDLAFVALSGRGGTSVENSGDQEAMVRGQHNSLVNIFYRLGVAGTLIFLQFILSLYKKMGAQELDSLYGILLLFALMDISTNVGLESPATFIQFVLIIGFVINAIATPALSSHSLVQNVEPVTG